MSFRDAFEPWLPTLQDIEVRKESEPLYRPYGWENLVVPDDCPHVSERMSLLKVLFDEKYAFRYINSETPSQWQIRLQTTFDKNVRRFERAYTLYEQYEKELLDDVIGGEKITRTVSGSETSENSSVSTPDLQINTSDEYADTRGKSKGTSELLDNLIRTKTGDGLIDSVNESFRKWVDIDIAFIEEFQNNFLNVFWY